MKRILRNIAVVAVAIAATACGNDWLDQEPSLSIPSGSAINSYYDLVTAQNGMYDGLQEDELYYGARMLYYGDVRGDDMQPTAAGKRSSAVYEMNYTAETAPSIWKTPYNVIRRANNIIKAVEDGKVKDGVEANVNHILGQAYAVRALVLFDLIRVYAQPYHLTNGKGLGVPIVLTPLEFDYKPKRNTLEECYSQIIEDLSKGISLMKTAKSTGYINAWAAKGILSRVYLYKHDYQNAYTTAVDVINNSPYKLWTNSEYAGVWSSAGNSELMFEIVNKGSDDWVDREAVGYLLAEAGYDDYIVTQSFYNLINENPKDVRLGVMLKPTVLSLGKKTINGVDVAGKKVYINKFPGRNDYSPTDVRVNNVPVIRLSEVYLNAAEAAAMRGSTADNAALYLNAIVLRADPTTTPVDAADATLDRILKERRKELVGEGHRFFDLMRNDKTVVRYTSESDKGWHCTIPVSASMSFDNTYFRAILPIPKEETDANVNIREQQNTGY